jgi:hypothetical protein
MNDPAQRAFVDQPLQGQEVRIPPPVVKDAEQPSCALCLSRNIAGIAKGRREGLVDQNMFACSQGRVLSV